MTATHKNSAVLVHSFLRQDLRLCFIGDTSNTNKVVLNSRLHKYFIYIFKLKPSMSIQHSLQVLHQNLTRYISFNCLIFFSFYLQFKVKLDRGSIRSSPRDGSSTPYRLTQEQCGTVTPCPCLHWRLIFDPSCTEFVCPDCWHFDNGNHK